jgi:hypothetical protein
MFMSWIRSRAALALMSGANCLLASTAYAQAGTTGTERLDVQVQSAAAQAAARPAPSAEPNTNCTLIVPRDALSAKGLATPYELTATDPAMGPCNEANTAQSAFVQAAILDPATGAISIYSPLVIDRGSHPLEPPVVPTLPAGAIVAIWFGYNADALTLKAGSGDDLANYKCVNGSSGGVFGQYAYCNAPAFFTAANAAIASGKLKVPALGTASDGKPCPTVRDFAVVDQDQSDNLPTLYLVSPRGHTLQMTKRIRRRILVPCPWEIRATTGCWMRTWIPPWAARPGRLRILPSPAPRCRGWLSTSCRPE